MRFFAGYSRFHLSGIVSLIIGLAIGNGVLIVKEIAVSLSK